MGKPGNASLSKAADCIEQDATGALSVKWLRQLPLMESISQLIRSEIACFEITYYGGSVRLARLSDPNLLRNMFPPKLARRELCPESADWLSALAVKVTSTIVGAIHGFPSVLRPLALPRSCRPVCVHE